MQILGFCILSCFSSVLLAERAVGKFVWIPHSVVIRPVLTWPGMLCTLHGHPPATTGVSSFSNSDLGIEPLLFSCVVLKSQVGEFCDKSFGFVLFFTYFLKLVLFAISGPMKKTV